MRDLDFGPLGSALGHLLRLAHLEAKRDLAARLAKFDISSQQYSIMLLFDGNPGLKHYQAADAIGIERTNLVGLVDALEERRLAIRREDTDRRCKTLYLTARGKALLAKLNAAHREHDCRLIEAIGPDGCRDLRRLLGKLIDAMRPADRAAAAE